MAKWDTRQGDSKMASNIRINIWVRVQCSGLRLHFCLTYPNSANLSPKPHTEWVQRVQSCFLLWSVGYTCWPYQHFMQNLQEIKHLITYLSHKKSNVQRAKQISFNHCIIIPKNITSCKDSKYKNMRNRIWTWEITKERCAKKDPQRKMRNYGSTTIEKD